MSKSLVIAEKPSVAADLARVLGKIPKKDDYFENDEYIVTSAVGHLVELCLPGEMDKKRGKWSFANLPIIPDHFELKPIEKTQTRFNLLKRLLKRADITDVINACDAGREGELIFHYLIQLAGTKKPTRRLWLQSMTPEAIKEGFAGLRNGQEMIPLAEAAVCRSESDWLVGINGTRAMTAFNSKGGGFQLTPVGRVQTPTLAILAEREEKVRAFKPRPFFEVYGDFGVAAGSYRGRWFSEGFKKNGDEDARAERIWDRAAAEAIVAKCDSKPGIVVEEKKPTSQIAPQLYDLTTLQREANSRFGLSAKRTLQIAQALYERHKVLTYPRTDSRYLPEDNIGNVKAAFTKLEAPDLAGHARKALSEGWVRQNKRIFNNTKVTDHHAIIPTGVSTKSLDDFELKVYDMVARRFVAAFYPAAQFEVTTRITRVEGEAFKTDGKIITDPGWMAVYGKQAASGDEQNVCAITSGETVLTEALEIKENETKPPPRFTEATLLSAMEGAGKLVDDEELREAMSQRGLGTPATRAQIIEGLILDGYLIRQARDLIVTSKGLSLITLLRGLGVQALTSPEMTGEWEHKLKRMERGEMPRPQFMEEIRTFTNDIVEKAKNFQGDTVDGNFEPLDDKCPKCGHAGFVESFKAFECGAKCGAIIWKNMAGRQFERDEVRKLLQDGVVGPLEGFRSKMGRPFAAVVKLDAECKQSFDFGDSQDSARQIDFSVLPSIGTCPVCKSGTIHDTGTAWQCSNTGGCKFRMGKSLCQREIPQEQVLKLLEAGKTDLISRFISKKGRPFSAYLKLDNGKVGFEFEERKPAAKKTARSRSAAADTPRAA
ncbi:MAG: DNA topoisomerase III [Verrucomicrobia bacterium]|nr:DNA topoisomerase III [Verrucomicrobiota bacterium]